MSDKLPLCLIFMSLRPPPLVSITNLDKLSGTVEVFSLHLGCDITLHFKLHRPSNGNINSGPADKKQQQNVIRVCHCFVLFKSF